MRKTLFAILILILLVPASCKKDNTPATSGTVTIDNTRSQGQTYTVYGFLFSQAKKVSKPGNPPPDITIDSDGTNLVLMADNFKNSFFKFGQYNDAASAATAFDNLTSATIQESQWEGLASPVLPDAIWIYRSGTTHYAKILITSIVSEVRSGHPYAECSFKWKYQPDGSLTFQGK